MDASRIVRTYNLNSASLQKFFSIFGNKIKLVINAKSPSTIKLRDFTN